MKFRSFLRYLDVRWFRGMKLPPTRPIQKRRFALRLEQLETRTMPSTVPTILSVTPTDGSLTANPTASPNPLIQIVFSEAMSGSATVASNYSLFGSAGNVIPVNAVTLTGPDASGHETATLTYNGGQGLVLDTYTLFVNGNQLTAAASLGGLPISGPGQFAVANVGRSAVGNGSDVSIVSMPGNDTPGANTPAALGGVSNYTVPAESSASYSTPVASVFVDMNGDGIPDLAILDNGQGQPNKAGQIDIFEGRLGGGFDQTPDQILALPVGSDNTPNSLIAGNFTNNSKGLLDLAVANFGTNNYTVFLNTSSSGQLTFGAGVNYLTGSGLLHGPTALASADFNNDGVPDLAIINGVADATGNFNVVFQQGVPNGTFIAPGSPVGFAASQSIGNATIPTTLQNPQSITTGNFDASANTPFADIVIGGIGNTINDGLELLLNLNPNVGVWKFSAPKIVPGLDLHGSWVSLVSGYLQVTTATKPGQEDIVALDDFNLADQVDILANNDIPNVASFTILSPISLLPQENPQGLALFTPNVASIYPLGNDTSPLSNQPLLNSKPDILITQFDPNGINATLAGAFTVLQNDSSVGTPSFAFAPGSPYIVDNNPYAVVTGDTNQDGNTDVITINDRNFGDPTKSASGDFTLLQGTGSSTGPLFATSQDTALTPNLSPAIAVGDLNGDGIPDMVVANNSSTGGNASITVMLGQLSNGIITYGSDSFVYPLQVSDVVSIAIGDVNGDGKPDILVADQQDSTVEVVANEISSSTLTFTSFVAQSAFAVSGGPGGDPTQIALGNFTNDPHATLDLLVAHQGDGGGVSYLPGHGDGTFGADTEYDAGNLARSLAVGDLNHDGNLDFVVVNSSGGAGPVSVPGAGTVTAFYGDGTGKFIAPEGNLAAGVSDPISVALSDLTGNGYLDIVVAGDTTSTTSGGVAVLLSEFGTGFDVPIVTPVLPGTALLSVTVAHVNQDAFPDLIVTTDPGPGGSALDNVFTLLGNGDGTFQSASPYQVGPFILNGMESPPLTPSIGALVSDPFIRVTTFKSGGTTALTNLVANGNFESRDLTNTAGNLLGWQQYELPDDPGGSHGTWSIQSGKTSPLSATDVTPATGNYQAMLDEADLIPIPSSGINSNLAPSYAGSTALYQDFTIPPNADSVTLSLTLNVKSPSGWTDNTVPQILDYRTSANNQQVRVDILNPNAPGFNQLGIKGSPGFLGTLYLSGVSDAPTQTITLTVSASGIITVSGTNPTLPSPVNTLPPIDLAQFAGQTIELRIATTNNTGQLIVGVDNVQVDALFNITTLPLAPTVALRDPGYVDPSTGTEPHTTDPTITGTVSDLGGLNNLAYIEIDPNNDSFAGTGIDSVFKINNWDPTGAYTFTIPNPKPGLNTINVATVDKAGIVSAITTFTFYFQGPSLTDWQAYGPQAINTTGQSGIGYTSVSGDITATAVDPTDPSGNTYYVGSDNGGVWKTTDGGQDWTPLTDYVTDQQGNPIPVPVGGLAISATVAPATNTHVLYAGTGVGNLNLDSRGGFGVLVSTDGGLTWAVDGDSGGANGVLTGATITKVVIDNNDPNIVYVTVASGGKYGPGVYQTTNALGNSSTSVNTAAAIWSDGTNPGGNILQNAENNGQMFLAAGGSVPAGTPLPSATDLIEDPFNSNRLILGLGNVTVGAVNPLAGVWLSINKGQTWTQIVGGTDAINIPNSTLPTGAGVGRVTLAMGTGRVGDEANVYVLIGTPPTSITAPTFNYGSEFLGTSMSGLYYSSNNMLDFTNVALKLNTAAAGQPAVFNGANLNLLGDDASNVGALVVDPYDPEVVYVGGSTLDFPNLTAANQSLIRVDVGDINGITDANTGNDSVTGQGVAWYNIAQGVISDETVQFVPPSVNALAFDAQGRLIIGTDEGIWRAVNQAYSGATLTAINGNLQISDLTSVAINPTTPGVLYTTMLNTGTAGSNGTLNWSSEDLTGPGANANNLGIPTASQVLIATPPPTASPSTPNTLFRVWEFANTGALIPETSIDGGAHWAALSSAGIPQDVPLGSNPAYTFPGFVIDPAVIFDSGLYENELLFGTNKVYITRTSTNVWDPISPVLSPVKGGLITAMAIGQPPQDLPPNPLFGVYYAGTNLGEIFVTTNNGASWQEIDTNLPNGPISAPVTSITVLPPNATNSTNYLTAYVTFGGTGTQHVFMTTNAGASWQDITSDLPPNVAANSLIIVPVTVNGVTTYDPYVATDVGVYKSVDGGKSWTRVGIGMPNVPVVSLQYNSTLATIAAATQGRGVFTLSTQTDGPYVKTLTNGSASSNTIDTLDVTFNEPINASTFLPSVITLTGPGGSTDTIAVTGVSNLDSGVDEAFAVTFAPQNANGFYNISFGPTTILDQTGNEMDQNQNGVNGEATDGFLGRVLFQPETNSAPVLGVTTATFPTTNEDSIGGNNGIDLASWVAANVPITDADPGAVKGIAITGVDDTNGTWQYSQNSGATWTNIPATASETSALVLQATSTNRIRFLPGTNYIGPATFTFRAWDLTSGLYTPPPADIVNFDVGADGASGQMGQVTVSVVPNGGTTAFSSAEATAAIQVIFANHPPTFTAGPNETAPENAGLVTVNNWATNISAGPPNEVLQTLTFIVTTNNPGLFAVQPAISPTGTLTYTPALDANGSATITVTLMDNGGTANGGQDSFASPPFVITITPVNQAPTFTGGPNQTSVVGSAQVTVPGFITNISPGAPNQTSETTTFMVSNNNPSLFLVQPTISANGTLIYQVGASIGTATVTVILMNNGGTANGGHNTSATYTFTITAEPVVSSGSADAVWISDVYRELLGREITTPEVSYWINVLNGGVSRLTVATEITSSPGYYIHFLQTLYMNYLGRNLDPSGENSFLAQLESGVSPTVVKAEILSSPEFYTRSGGTTFGFLSALYKDVLGSTMDTAGQAYWATQLANGATMYQVALGILTSPAGEAGVVQAAYQLLLGRSPNAGDIAYWSGLPDGALAANIAATPEYGLDSSSQFYNSQPDQTWLNHVFQDTLGHNIDAASLSQYILQIREGVRLPAVVSGILSSPEYYSDIVTAAFTKILKRAPDATSVGFFVNILNHGGSLEYVESLMYGSSEFFTIEGGGTDQGFLQALYPDVLNRPLDTTGPNSGASYWEAFLAQIPSTQQVAYDVVTSPEADADLISAAFQNYLRRPVDTNSLLYWENMLQGGMTELEFFAQLLGSAEYYAKFSG